MINPNPVNTSMDSSIKLVFSFSERYTRLVGMVNYLIVTRPDIDFVVCSKSIFRLLFSRPLRCSCMNLKVY